jgi:hypothetical protein
MHPRLLTRDSKNPEIHNNLGVALAALSHWAEAQASYRKALELAPGTAPVPTHPKIEKEKTKTAAKAHQSFFMDALPSSSRSDFIGTVWKSAEPDVTSYALCSGDGNQGRAFLVVAIDEVVL